MKEPLGRIHPHGSGGKSVYQRAAQESNEVFESAFSFICGCVGYGLLGLCAIAFIGALATTGEVGSGLGVLMILGVAAALING